jgi:hypothetical protein
MILKMSIRAPGLDLEEKYSQQSSLHPGFTCSQYLEIAQLLNDVINIKNKSNVIKRTSSKCYNTGASTRPAAAATS